MPRDIRIDRSRVSLFKTGCSIAILAYCSVGPLALAQSGPTTPPGSPETRLAKVAISAGQQHLMKRYGVTAEDAAGRLSHKDAVSKLSRELYTGNEADFGAIWIEHAPTYRIVLAFKGGGDRSAVLQRVDPLIRPFVQIKAVTKSRAELDAATDTILLALKNAGFPFNSYYAHETDKLVVEVRELASVAVVKRLLPPPLNSEVEVRQAELPVPDQVVSGARGGEEVYAGWWMHPSATVEQHSCSFSFAVKDNQNRDGILTAGHCTGPYWINYAGYRVQIAEAIADWNAPDTKYDYQYHVVTGLRTGPYVFFDNDNIDIQGYEYRSNNVPGYPADGYFQVRGTRGYYDQVVGQPVCKSGRSTGFTCGEITHGSFTHKGVRGWIQYGNSTQDIMAYAGDSGGAVYDEPTVLSDTWALGVHSSSTGVYDTAGNRVPCTETATRKCYGISMPIDYIDDQQLLTVQTLPY